jgi:phosphatidate cytidylyltransferase
MNSIMNAAWIQRMSPELRKRVATGAGGALVLLLLVIFGGRVGVAFVAVVVSLGMVWEFVDICFNLSDKPEKKLILVGTTWLLAFTNFLMPRAEYELLITAFLALFGYFLFTAGRHEGQDFDTHFRELMFSVFGLIYLAFLPLYLVLIRDSAQGVHWTILFLLIVWSGDTGAYFAGKRFGRHKLYEKISPKKTIEGGLGGLGSGVIIAILYKLLLFPSMSWAAAVFIPIFVGAVSQVGDLCESFLKRAFNRKDSGSLLPGHGGLLDRFDGVVFSLPAMYATIRIFGVN